MLSGGEARATWYQCKGGCGDGEVKARAYWTTMFIPVKPLALPSPVWMDRVALGASPSGVGDRVWAATPERLLASSAPSSIHRMGVALRSLCACGTLRIHPVQVSGASDTIGGAETLEVSTRRASTRFRVSVVVLTAPPWLHWSGSGRQQRGLTPGCHGWISYG